MSKQTLKKLACSILTTALMVAFVNAFTQKTGKTADIALRDVLEKVARNKVRVKDPGKFELLIVDGRFAVREKSTRRLVKGTAGCRTCPGGDCKGTIAGGCSGCGKGPEDSLCTIDPF